MQMAAAYAAFAAHGVYCRPIAIDSIDDAEGNPVDVPSANCTQAMTSDAADKTAMTLTHVLSKDSKGTGKDVALNGRPAAGKTGTTESMDNAWFTGFTPQLSTAVWLGHSEGYYPMDHQYVGGRYYQTMYGSDAPAPLWKMYMDAALAGQPAQNFNPIGLSAMPSGAPSAGGGDQAPGAVDNSSDSATPAAEQSSAGAPVPQTQPSQEPQGQVSQGQPSQDQAQAQQPRAQASQGAPIGTEPSRSGIAPEQGNQNTPATPPNDWAPPQNNKDGN